MLVSMVRSSNFSTTLWSASNNKTTDYKKVSYQNLSSPAFLGQSKVYSDAIKSLKQEMESYPDDIAYRKKLLANAGINADCYYNLRSIVGPDEIKSIMSEFNEHGEFYSAGVNDINVKNGTIRANMHIHTVASDGFFTTQELLDNAAAYANEVVRKHPEFKQTPFVIAITDHDTVEGAQEAIKIIAAANPDKYKNLRVILGVEFTTYDTILPKALGKQINIDVLAYGIDPNEKTLTSFIEGTKQYKRRIASEMIDKANNIYQTTFETKQTPFSVEQAGRLYTPIARGIIEAHRHTESYIETKFILKEVILKDEELRRKMKEKGLPLDADLLIDEIIKFYYPKDANTKKHGGLKTISTFLSNKLDINAKVIEEIIKKTNNSNIKNFNKALQQLFEEYHIALIPKHKEMPDMQDLLQAVQKQKKVIFGIAHPLKYLKKVKGQSNIEPFIVDLYKKFKQAFADRGVFSEVYYQSYTDGPKGISLRDDIVALLKGLSTKFDLFKTGGFDCHRKNLFRRHW